MLCYAVRVTGRGSSQAQGVHHRAAAHHGAVHPSNGGRGPLGARHTRGAVLHYEYVCIIVQKAPYLPCTDSYATMSFSVDHSNTYPRNKNVEKKTEFPAGMSCLDYVPPDPDSFLIGKCIKKIEFPAGMSCLV